MIKYKMNLVKSVREAEKLHVKHRSNMVLMLIVCFGILAIAGFNVYTKLAIMEATVEEERGRLKNIRDSLRNYQETQSVIDKADIELLNRIQNSRIYWTKKLEAMASHLPEEDPTSYWITKFSYRAPIFTVQGFGYITEQQEQLLTLDEYMNKLRADANYSDIFGMTTLKSAVRSDEESGGTKRERVSFEYTSTRIRGM